VKAGRTFRTARQRSATLSGSRRAFLVVLYAVLLVGTPFGHAILLSVHVATDHASLPAFNEWFSARVRNTMRTVDEAYHAQAARLDDDHLRMHASGESHGHAVASADTRDHHTHSANGTADQPEAQDGQAGDEHRHGNLIHTHASDLASELASLTGTLAKHYFPPHPLFVDPSIVIVARSVWTSPAMQEVAGPVQTPPPRTHV